MTTITPLGVETLVNTATAQTQFQPTTTQLANGRYVVVWTDYVTSTASTLTTAADFTNYYATTDIKAQIFEANGTRVGGEILVNATTAGAQWTPRVVELSDGNFLVAWQDGTGLTLGSGATVASTVSGREFTANGAAVGSQFAIGTAGVQSSAPAIAAVAGGGFMAFWQEGYVSTSNRGALVGQVFSNTNAPLGTSFVVDNTNLNARTLPIAATLSNGNVVVAWTNAALSSPFGISYRVYNDAGNAVSAEQTLGPNGNFGQSSAVSSIAALSNGGFALAYVERNTNTSQQTGIVLAADQAGSMLASAVYSQQPTNSSFIADIAGLPNGGAVLTYSDVNADGSSTGITAILFNASGNMVGSPTLVNTTTALDQAVPSVSVLTNGDFVVAWIDGSGTGGDTSGTAIRSQIFDVNYTNAAPVAVADTFSVTGDGTIDASQLLDNDTDPDGDVLRISAISNVQNGTAVLDANGNVIISRTPGNNLPLRFDYTVSDGSLTSTPASVTVNYVSLINDTATVRGTSPVLIDVLANDILPGSLSEYQIFFGVNLTTGANVPVVTANGRQNLSFQATDEAYFNLLVGTTSTVTLRYVITSATQNAGGSADVTVTQQGWAQLGGAGNDNLVGGALADHLSGGDGVNTLTGGGGDDYYTVNNTTTTVVELANGGIDTVRLTPFITTYVLPANVENLSVMQSAPSSFNLTGNELDNVITGTATSYGIMRGLDGNDILIAPGGGSAGQPNQLFGGDGNDRLIGSTSNNLLNGGAGNDYIQGSNTNAGYSGPESTQYILGDLISYADNQGAIYADIAANFVLESALQSGTINATTALVSQDSLFSIEHVIGSAYGDRIYGTDGNNFVAGGMGSDIIYGLNGQDTIDYSTNTGAVFADLAASTVLETGLTTGTVSAATAVLSTDYIFSFEDLIGSAFGDRLYGTASDNVISGGAGDDIIYSLGGNDRLYGGDGADSIIGGAGADTMRGGAGADRFFFTEGPQGQIMGSNGFLIMDTINDFEFSVDKIYLLRSAFGLAPGEALTFTYDATATAAHSFLWNSGGILSYDADGAGGAAPIIVAQLFSSSGGTLTPADIVLYG
jgi:Ca2+-binding RTX toxin-like protein